MAEFESADMLLSAARSAHQGGYRAVEAYTPFPIDGLSDALGDFHTPIPLITLLGGITGGVGGFLLQVWAMYWSYPLNIGHRPYISWPAYIPVVFEMTILCASLAAFFGTLFINRFPEPYHPVSNVPQFLKASKDRFFLCIQSADSRFDPVKTRQFLRELGAIEVHDVEP